MTNNTKPAWFAESPLFYRRRKSREVKIGNKWVGGSHPILVQSMATTDTMDTGATVAQCLRMAAVGCELLRITAPTPKHSANLKNIRQALNRAGCDLPIVADIHFMPEAAMEAALHVEKVRVNPGNYADTKRFAVKDYSDEAYADELRRIEERFSPLARRCKELGRAMRVGTNHGSLSDRIMNRFGDTPLGMVESALEFLRIARGLDYHDIILSMKSSNPKVMIQAYRLLVMRMDEEGMDYPLHLGVTEAGDGEDGRIKSAVGIASLLEDGIGDTVRVSLTEDPELEMPVAYRIANRYPEAPSRGSLFEGVDAGRLGAAWISGHAITEFQARQSRPCALGPFSIDRSKTVRVISAAPHKASDWERNWRSYIDYRFGSGDNDISPEAFLFSVKDADDLQGLKKFHAQAAPAKLAVLARFDLADAWAMAPEASADMVVLRLPQGALSAGTSAKFDALLTGLAARQMPLMLEFSQGPAAPLFEGLDQALASVEARGIKDLLICLRGFDASQMLHLSRALVTRLDLEKKNHAFLAALDSEEDAEDLRISAATLFGSLLCDGLGDSILIESGQAGVDTVGLSFNILQASKVRVSKTDFISCPSCGRTLFDLQEVTARIKGRTQHLVGVKIAIMGCIVNGPGEMADADFGYVGGAPDQINLYVGKNCVEKGIPFAEADERLVELIKKNGMWKEPASR
jgi:(E)-4-hydroxy-3-methylbut-2-enyl-diphosphate synthase